MHELVDEIAQLHTSVNELSTTTEDVAGSVRGLADRIRLLERRLRSSGKIAVVDLDHWPTSCSLQATAIRAGKDAQSDVLQRELQDQWKAQINQPELLRNTMRANRATALDAARTLTELDHANIEGWQRAVNAWNIAITARAEAAKKLKEAEKAAQQARHELEAALARHKVAQPKVKLGTEARTALLIRIRTRISDAIHSDLLFPAWFEMALGSGAPTANTQSWIDTAVALVAYRLVNNIDDQVSALGQRPSGSGWQQKEHDELTRACRYIAQF
jgi:hypothetical protein